MKAKLLTVFMAGMIVSVAAPALAEVAIQCQADLDAIDRKATTTAPVTPAELAEAIRLRNLGQAECEAGNTTQGLVHLAEAKAILGGP